MFEGFLEGHSHDVPASRIVVRLIVVDTSNEKKIAVKKDAFTSLGNHHKYKHDCDFIGYGEYILCSDFPLLGREFVLLFAY